MDNLTPFQLRATALQRSRGPMTAEAAPQPLAPVQNRVWLAARTIAKRYDSTLFVYALVENDTYGTKGFTHTARLPQHSAVADEYAAAVNFALKNLPREDKTALHTNFPVLDNDLPSEFQDLQVHPCTAADNPAATNLERFIRDSSPYR